MKKSQLRKVIRESIKGLMNEQNQPLTACRQQILNQYNISYTNGFIYALVAYPPGMDSCSAPNYNTPNFHNAFDLLQQGTVISQFQTNMTNGFNNNGCSFITNKFNSILNSLPCMQINAGQCIWSESNPVWQAKKINKMNYLLDGGNGGFNCGL